MDRDSIVSASGGLCPMGWHEKRNSSGCSMDWNFVSSHTALGRRYGRGDMVVIEFFISSGYLFLDGQFYDEGKGRIRRRMGAFDDRTIHRIYQMLSGSSDWSGGRINDPVSIVGIPEGT